VEKGLDEPIANQKFYQIRQRNVNERLCVIRDFAEGSRARDGRFDYGRASRRRRGIGCAKNASPAQGFAVQFGDRLQVPFHPLVVGQPRPDLGQAVPRDVPALGAPARPGRTPPGRLRQRRRRHSRWTICFGVLASQSNGGAAACGRSAPSVTTAPRSKP